MHEEIFTSELFTFVLGHDKKEVTIHSEAIARLSHSLNAMIRGPMRESQEKIVVWDDVEAGDFIRLSQFAYCGDYSPAKPQSTASVAEESEVQQEDSKGLDATLPLEEAVDAPLEEFAVPPIEEPTAASEPEISYEWARTQWISSHSHRDPPKKKSKNRVLESVPRTKDALKTEFQSKVFPEDRTWNTPSDLYEPVALNLREEDFTPVFLGHARLYVLGSKYIIKNLTSLALHKLYQTLKMFKLYKRRINDVIELVRYTYANTSESPKDALRTLVKDYVAAEIDVVGKSTKFKSLLAEGGEFVVDFWETMSKHIS
ncbi:MAG: hypothetical protein M1820_001201 [Bogoriella megaspora]|nr:MAG: hypothetical protein M1820_001201 [Bogoriella megaspora]